MTIKFLSCKDGERKKKKKNSWSTYWDAVWNYFQLEHNRCSLNISFLLVPVSPWPASFWKLITQVRRLLSELFRKDSFSLKPKEVLEGGKGRHHLQERKYQITGFSLIWLVLFESGRKKCLL